MMDDKQLLHAYTRERSESAFGELVTRHIDFVYSAALRVVNGDSHLAEDVAQLKACCGLEPPIRIAALLPVLIVHPDRRRQHLP